MGRIFLQNRPFKFPEKIIDNILKNLEIEPYLNEHTIEGCYEMDHSVVLEKAVKASGGYRIEDAMKCATKRIPQIISMGIKSDGGFSFYKDSSIQEHNYCKVAKNKKESDMVGSVFFLQSILSLCKILCINHQINNSMTHG
eukprot:COSAG01_NODE_755_length_13819_cov_130.671939_10_plen_141_part_00